MNINCIKSDGIQDGNGRTAVLIEKWFPIDKIGQKAAYVQLEKKLLQKTKGLLFKYQNDWT